MSHMLRTFIMLLISVVSVWADAAPARHILDLDAQKRPVQLLDWGDHRIDTSGSMTLQEILADRSKLTPTMVSSAYRLKADHALWITFAVPATTEELRWYVKLPAAGIDHVTLHTQQPDRTWTTQESGDSLVATTWPIPHMYPVLPLAVSAAEPTYYALRIESSEGFFAPIEFINEAQLTAEIQRLSLLYGAYLGLLAMGAVFALATGLVLRDRAYLWFGLWAGATLFAMMSTTGIAGLHLWPDRPEWNATLPYAFPILSASALLVFVAEALLVLERFPALYWASVWIAVFSMSIAILVSSGVWEGEARLWIALTAAAIAGTATMFVACWSIRRRDPFSLRVLAALIPVLLAFPVCALALLQQPVVALPVSVIALVTLGLSVPATYLVLALRSQERREHRTRISRLAQIDPTTGLINEVVFANRLRELTGQSIRLGHQSFVALVDFGNLEQLRSEFGRKRALELLLRLGDRLTSMLRNVGSI